MRVKNGRNKASRRLNFRIHLGKTVFCEVLRIESEVFIAISSSVVVSPLDIKEENIDRELGVGEVLVTISNNIRGNLVIL